MCSSRFFSASSSAIRESRLALASIFARSSDWRSNEVCEEDGESQSDRRREGDRCLRAGLSPTTAPTDGTRGGGRGRSSTMMGRPRATGELGAV